MFNKLLTALSLIFTRSKTVKVEAETPPTTEPSKAESEVIHQRRMEFLRERLIEALSNQTPLCFQHEGDYFDVISVVEGYVTLTRHKNGDLMILPIERVLTEVFVTQQLNSQVPPPREVAEQYAKVWRLLAYLAEGNHFVTVEQHALPSGSHKQLIVGLFGAYHGYGWMDYKGNLHHRYYGYYAHARFTLGAVGGGHVAVVVDRISRIEIPGISPIVKVAVWNNNLQQDVKFVYEASQQEVDFAELAKQFKEDLHHELKQRTLEYQESLINDTPRFAVGDTVVKVNHFREAELEYLLSNRNLPLVREYFNLRGNDSEIRRIEQCRVVQHLPVGHDLQEYRQHDLLLVRSDLGDYPEVMSAASLDYHRVSSYDEVQ